MWELFTLGFVLCLSLCLDLGVVNLAVIRTGVQQGLRPSFLVGLGSTFGDMVYMILSTTGVVLLLHILWVRYTLWIGGTLVLLYMGGQMLRESFRDKNLTGGGDTKPVKNYFFSGFGLALSSPSAILWYVTIGGSVIATQAMKAASLQVYFFAGFCTASFLWSTGLAWLSAQGGRLIGPRVVRVINRVSAVVFVLLALKVFWDGWQSFA